jgi:hypothetical protein
VRRKHRLEPRERTVNHIDPNLIHT